jgi:hypothetical protein
MINAPRKDISYFSAPPNAIPIVTAKEDRISKPFLYFLVIQVGGWSFYFYSNDFALNDGFNELNDIICLRRGEKTES